MACSPVATKPQAPAKEIAVLPPAEIARDVAAPAYPKTIGGTVDYAPVCAAALETARSQLQSLRDWIKAHTPATQDTQH